MEILGKLFDSPARVRIMRLFLFHPQKLHTKADIASRSSVNANALARELRLLAKIGFIAKRTTTKTTVRPSGKRTKKTINGYRLSPKFHLTAPLRSLLIDHGLVDKIEMTKRLRQTGRLQLLVLAGVFFQEERKLDALVVGTNLSKKKIDAMMATLESDVGKELKYAVFTHEEFKYRLNMYDKLIRDMFSHQHEIMVDKIGVKNLL